MRNRADLDDIYREEEDGYGLLSISRISRERDMDMDGKRLIILMELEEGSCVDRITNGE